MAIYNIAGLQVEIPTLADIENVIIQSVNGVVTQAINNVINPIISGITNIFSPITAQINAIFSFLQGIPQQLVSFAGSIGDIIYSRIIQPVQSFLSSTASGINSILAELQSLPNQFINLSSSIGDFVYSRIIQPIQNGFAAFGSQINSSLAVLETIPQQIQNIPTYIRGFFQTDIVQPLSAFITPVLSEINAIGADVRNTAIAFNSAAAAIQNTITDEIGKIGQVMVAGVTSFFTTAIQPILNGIGQFYVDAVNAIYANVKQVFFTKISDDPTVALEQVVERAAGIGASVVGTILTLKVLENIHPFHTLKLEEGFKHILEFVGIYDLGRETLKLFVDNGIGLQAEYALNYQFQAKKLSVGEAAKGVWYGTRTMDDFRKDARFEGFEDDAIDTLAGTLYKPMPAFILEKLIELAVVDVDFSTKQLLREGFDPADIPGMLKGFNNLNLNAFQGTARSLIYTMYKDGMIAASAATEIMTAFAIPEIQQGWILQLANYQFQYEQKLDLQNLIITEVKKGGYKKPDAAISDLVSLGIDTSRATLLVKKAAVESYITLSKSDKEALAQQFSSLLS